jgi:hypothetical protein
MVSILSIFSQILLGFNKCTWIKVFDNGMKILSEF